MRIKKLEQLGKLIPKSRVIYGTVTYGDIWEYGDNWVFWSNLYDKFCVDGCYLSEVIIAVKYERGVILYLDNTSIFIKT